MGYTQAWGAIDSKFAEAGIIEGCLVKRSAAGALKVTAGLVRLKVAIGTMHVQSLTVQVGDLALADSAAIDIGAGGLNLANGIYAIYAHPVLDANGFTNGIELRVGGKIKKVDGTDAAEIADAASDATRTDANADVPICPEGNYDASAAKMLASVPNSDFYVGRSIRLAYFKVAAADVTEINYAASHRF